jgi:cytosine permease
MLFVTPALAVVQVWCLYHVIEYAGGWSMILAWEPPNYVGSYGIFLGCTAAAGSYLLGAVTSGDYNRFAKTYRSGIAAWLLGLTGGLYVLLVIGAISYAAFYKVIGADAWNVVVCMGYVSMKTGIIALFVMAVALFILAMWTTQAATLYWGSVQLAGGLRRYKLYPMIGMNIVATIMAIVMKFSVGALATMSFFIFSFLTLILPPIGGMLIADFFVIKRAKPYPKETLELTRRFNPITYPIWVVSAIAEFLLREANLGFPLLNGLAIAFILYVAIMLPLQKKSHPLANIQ